MSSAKINLELRSGSGVTDADVFVDGERKDILILLAITFARIPELASIAETAAVISRTPEMQKVLGSGVVIDLSKDQSVTPSEDIV